MVTRRQFAFAGAVAAAAAMIIAVTAWPRISGLDPTNPKVTLGDIETTVARSFPVPEISNGGLSGLASDVVLFDVREADEFAQSHIAGAKRIDPGMSQADFLARYGGEIAGKRVVFYCAVGVRSGIMLARVQSALPGLGVQQAYNLRGGIFRWYAAGGPVVAQSGPAQSVHPYDGAWKQLLDRTLSARTTAPSPAPTGGRW